MFSVPLHISIRTLILLLFAVVAAGLGYGQTLPPAAEAGAGVRFQLTGQIVYRIPSREALQPWANPNGLQVTVQVSDSGGEAHRIGTAGATGGRLSVNLPAPEESLLIPVSDYVEELVALFAGSFFGPVSVRPVVSSPNARIQKFDQFSVRTADGTQTGIIQRRAETPTSNINTMWLYCDRDLTISASGRAPGVSGEIDLRLKRGWNTLLYILVYERGRDGRILLRSANEPAGMQWVYWQWGE